MTSRYPISLLGILLLLTQATPAKGPRQNTVATAKRAAPGSSTRLDSELDGLKPYTPEQQVSGVIRNFGNNYIPELLKAWEDGFRLKQPGITFETDLPGSEAAMAGLYSRRADLAFIGRESYASELHVFEETLGHPPLEIEISSGSFETPHKTFALMVFVHKSNPLAKLTLRQLANVYGCMSSGRAITEWGQLGVHGVWEHRPVHVYGYSLETGMARYFQRTVLSGSDRWTDNLRDFDNGHDANGAVINAGVYVLDALAQDPDGIAYANFLYAGPNVKVLALSKGDGSNQRFWPPTRINAYLRRYPLTRFTIAALDRTPGKPVDPKLKEFLRYILSRDGMKAVIEDEAYMQLNPKQVDIELKKLE